MEFFLETAQFIQKYNIPVDEIVEPFLKQAICRGSMELVQFLKQNSTEEAFEKAIGFFEGCDDVEQMKLAIQAGVDVARAMNTACENGNIDIVELLLENENDIQCGGMPMRLATTNGHLNIVRLLLKRSLDAAESLRYDDTLFHLACANGYLEIATLLLEYGSRIGQDHTLPAAAQNGHHEIVRLLLDRGVSDQSGDALNEASGNGHIEVVRLLLEYGTSVNEYAMAIASKQGYLEIVRLLLENGGNIQRYRDLALLQAVQFGHMKVASLLKKAGPISRVIGYQ